LFVVGLLLYRNRWDDFFSVLCVRRKDAKVTDGVFSGRGYEGADYCDLLMDIPSVIVEILQHTAQFQQSSISSRGESRIAVVPSLQGVFS